jgi:hypothetical protein
MDLDAERSGRRQSRRLAEPLKGQSGSRIHEGVEQPDVMPQYSRCTQIRDSIFHHGSRVAVQRIDSALVARRSCACPKPRKESRAPVTDDDGSRAPREEVAHALPAATGVVESGPSQRQDDVQALRRQPLAHARQQVAFVAGSHPPARRFLSAR